MSIRADAKIGAWLTIAPDVKPGGLIGGGIMGKVACLGSLRGQLDTAAEYASGNLFYKGKVFAVAGVGFDCDEGTWTSVNRSRKDDWCGTGDVELDVIYEDEEWDYEYASPTVIH